MTNHKYWLAPIYLFLLPLFFVVHGLSERYPLSAADIAILLLIYWGVSLLLFVFFRLFFKDAQKAGFLAFLLMAFNFFFGSAHDFLKEHIGKSIVVKYSFVVPAFLVVFLLLLFYLKRRKDKMNRTTKYLNVLMIILILLDAGGLVLHREKPHKEFLSDQFRRCDTCQKPDVYLIIADEYAGKTELNDLFGFDNTQFETDLRNRGFHLVNDTRSNYNFTVYSMASMLNMQYLQNLEKNSLNERDVFTCRELIKKNEVTGFLKQNGYTVYNCSFFDLESAPRAVTSFYFLPYRNMVTAQTFTSRFNYDLGAQFATAKKIVDIKKRNLYNVNDIDRLASKIALEKKGPPKFVYVHFPMPHHPYFLDRNGKPRPIDSIADEYKVDRRAYLDYLLYANKRLIALIDHINSVSSAPPVIVLMSDHGFHEFADADTVAKKYHFMTLNAVRLPGGDYKGFYDGMSNVNEFRVLLNTQFGQQLPLLKDSSVFITE